MKKKTKKNSEPGARKQFRKMVESACHHQLLDMVEIINGELGVRLEALQTILEDVAPGVKA